MNKQTLIAAIENQSQLYIDQMTPKQIAYIDGNNRALMNVIDLINKHLDGYVIAKADDVEELCFAIRNPDFIKAMNGAEALNVTVTAVEETLINAHQESNEND